MMKMVSSRTMELEMAEFRDPAMLRSRRQPKKPEQEGEEVVSTAGSGAPSGKRIEPARPPASEPFGMTWQAIVREAWTHGVLPRTVPLLLFVHAIHITLISTYWIPDEWYQGPELAHKAIFGQGLDTWETTDGRALRAGAWPLALSGIYKGLDLVGLASNRFAYHYSPYALSVIAGVGTDVAISMLAFVLTGSRRIALFSLFAWISNWWTTAFTARLLVSNWANLLTVVGLIIWPWPSSLEGPLRKPGNLKLLPRYHEIVNSIHGRRRVALFLAGLSVYLRPPQALIWVALIVTALIDEGCRVLRRLAPLNALKWLLNVTFWDAIPSGLVAAGIGAGCDYVWYGRPVFSPLHFLEWNVVVGVGSEYGENSLWYYWLVGIPAMLNFWGIFWLFGLVRLLKTVSSGRDSATPLDSAAAPSLRPGRSLGPMYLCVMSLLVVLVLSGSTHKEMRFISGVMPLCAVIAAIGLEGLRRPKAEDLASAAKVKLDMWEMKKRGGKAVPRGPLWVGLILYPLVMMNLLAGGYLLTIHQAGPMSANAQLIEANALGKLRAVDYYLNCHEAPGYAALHPVVNPDHVELRMFDCSPPQILDPDDPARGQPDEATRFQADPAGYVSSLYSLGVRKERPSHVVVLQRWLEMNDGALEKWMQSTWGAEECGRHEHKEWSRDEQYIAVWCVPAVGGA